MRFKIGNLTFGTYSYVFLLMIFLISFINPILVLLLYFFLVVGAVSEPIEGSVRGLILVMFRGCLNTALAVSGNQFQIIKWMMILGLAIWLLINLIDCTVSVCVMQCFFWITFFSFFAIIASFLNGSYPIVSLFKTVAFILPCISIIKGIYACREVDWNHFLFCILLLLYLISLIVLPFERFRIVNNDFQGAFNHVNGMGTMCAIFIAIILHEKESFICKNRILRNLLVAIVLFMEYQSKSRTGMIAAITVILVYCLTSDIKLQYKITSILIWSAIIGCIVVIMDGETDELLSLIRNYMYKGNASAGILASRNSQIVRAMTKFRSSYLIGGGFMTPYNENIKSYIFSFDLVVEPGNLFLSVLGDTGIIGFILFLGFLVKVLLSGNRKSLCILVAVVMVNMGEMVFFSSNSEGILMYSLLAIYLLSGREEQEINESL